MLLLGVIALLSVTKLFAQGPRSPLVHLSARDALCSLLGPRACPLSREVAECIA